MANLRAFLETECGRLELENFDLLESCDADSGDDDFSITNGDECEAAESHLQSIIGHRRYSAGQLYHSLLADQVPVSKIAKIIRSVLKCSILPLMLISSNYLKKHVLVTCAENN